MTAAVPAFTTAVVLLYGAHLCGHEVPVIDLLPVVRRRWDEALGRGLLAGRGVARWRRGRVRLTRPLTEVLDAGVRASSSGNMQTYSIIVTRDRALREQLYEPHMEQEMVLDAPALLTFCADFRRMRHWLRLSAAPDNFDNFMSFMIAAIDATLVSQNVALAAEARGLGLAEGFDPFMTLAFMALPVIPKLKLTEAGLVDVEKFEVVPLVF